MWRHSIFWSSGETIDTKNKNIVHTTIECKCKRKKIIIQKKSLTSFTQNGCECVQYMYRCHSLDLRHTYSLRLLHTLSFIHFLLTAFSIGLFDCCFFDVVFVVAAATAYILYDISFRSIFVAVGRCHYLSDILSLCAWKHNQNISVQNDDYIYYVVVYIYLHIFRTTHSSMTAK